MRLNTTMLALLLASSGAWAEWVKVDQVDDASVYIDPTTIRKDGNLRRVWGVQDLKQREKNGVLSRRIRYEYDCKQERPRFLSISTLSGPMATGEILFMVNDPEKSWRDIAPGTPDETFLKILCAK